MVSNITQYLSTVFRGTILFAFCACYSVLTFLLALSLARDKEKLLNEVTTMLSFHHPNVMSLIGMCFDGDMPMVIMPYMSNGSVLGYVKMSKRELLFDCEVGQEVSNAVLVHH